MKGLIASLAAVAVLAAGCGGGSPDTQSADRVSEALGTPSAEEPTTSKPSDDSCKRVPAELLRTIEEGAEDGVGKIKLTNGWATRAPARDKVWLIVAELSAAGVKKESAVWAKSGPLAPGGGLLLSVDGVAKEFTVWPDADKTKAEIDINEPGYDQTVDCLKG